MGLLTRDTLYYFMINLKYFGYSDVYNVLFIF